MRQVLVLTLAAFVLAAPAAAQKPKPKHPRITHSGTLVARSARSVTVKRGERTLTCSRGDLSPKLGGARVGHRVKVSCADGVLVAFARAFSGSAAGTISSLSASGVVVHTDGGDVACSVGEHSPKLGDFHVGDKAKLSCEDGVLAAIAKLEPPAEVQTGVGTISVLTDASLTVHVEGRDLTCTRGDRSPRLGDFRVGDKVKVGCTNHVLTAIAKIDLTMIAGGVISALSPTSLTIVTDGGERTCTRTSSAPSLDGYVLGDRVKMTCTNGVLSAIAKADLTTTAAGVLSALSADSLTVHTDGGDLTCRLGDGSPGLGDFHIGDNVKIYCKNNVLTAIAKADTTVTITKGKLAAMTPTSVTVLSDGGEKTCTRGSGSPSLDGYVVGSYVKATCTNAVLTAIEHL